MSFFTRPSLEDRQFKQLSGDTLTLSGNTSVVATGNLTVNGTYTLDSKRISASGGTAGQVLTLDTFGVIKLADSTGSGGTGYYVGATPSTLVVGGIPAISTLTGKTFGQLFEELLVPYLIPKFSSFTIQGQASYVDVGTVLSGSRTFNWSLTNPTNVSANTVSILDLTAPTTLGSSLANDGTESLTLTTNTLTSNGETQQWKATAISTNGITANSTTITITGIHPYFWGTATGTTKPAATNSLVTGGTPDKKVVGVSTGTITIPFNSTNDKYIWFAIPSTSTSKTSWYVNTFNSGAIGGGDNLFSSFATVGITTANWAGVNYKVYISNYKSAVTTNMELRN